MWRCYLCRVEERQAKEAEWIEQVEGVESNDRNNKGCLIASCRARTSKHGHRNAHTSRTSKHKRATAPTVNGKDSREGADDLDCDHSTTENS